jgi:hypothetical protein
MVLDEPKLFRRDVDRVGFHHVGIDRRRGPIDLKVLRKASIEALGL